MISYSAMISFSAILVIPQNLFFLLNSVKTYFKFQYFFAKFAFEWFFLMQGNGYVYGKLRVCVRGFSVGKSEASKRATNFGLAKNSNFIYTML